MNKAGSFVLGFVTGGVSVGIPLYFVLKNKFDKRMSEQIENFKHNYRGGIIAKKEALEERKAKKEVEEPVKYTIGSSLDGGPTPIERTEYHKMAANYRKTEADLATHGDLVRGDGIENIDISGSEALNERPEREYITYEEFDEAEDDCDRVEMLWYVLDDVIVDQYSEVLEDRDKVFGALINDDIRDSIINSEAGGDHLICIRNNVTKVDYLVDVETEFSHADYLESLES